MAVPGNGFYYILDGNRLSVTSDQWSLISKRESV